MRQESAVALGKAEAERWVMDRNRSGRSTAGAGKAALDVIQVAAEQIARQMERKQSTSKGAEWLLDNLHLVQRIGKAMVRSFRSGREFTCGLYTGTLSAYSSNGAECSARFGRRGRGGVTGLCDRCAGDLYLD